MLEKNSLTDKKIFNILIIIAMVFWGASWVSAKSITSLLKSEIIVFWRFLLCFFSLIPVLLFFKKKLTINRYALIYTFITAALMTFYNQLFFSGLKYGYANLGGIIVTCFSPVMTFTISSFLNKKLIKKKEIFGLSLGLLGALFLLQLWTLDAKLIFKDGNLYFIIAALVWAIVTILSQKAQKTINPIVYSFYVYGFISLISFVISCYLKNDLLALPSTPIFWFNIIFLAIGPTTFAGVIYFIGTSKLGAQNAGSYMFIVPVSAIFLSFVFLGEIPSLTTITGGALAILAVYIINHKKKPL